MGALFKKIIMNSIGGNGQMALLVLFSTIIVEVGTTHAKDNGCPRDDTCVVIKKDDPIMIAPMISKTGQTGTPTGKGQAQGLVVAHEKRHQVLGHEVELVGNPSGLDDISLENGIILPNWDDGSSASTGTDRANALLSMDADKDAHDNDVLAIIGLSNSSAAAAVIPIFSAAKYLMLGTGVLGTQLTNLGLTDPYFARTSPTGSVDAIAMADFICGDPSCGEDPVPCKVAVIHDGNTAFSQTVAQAFINRCVDDHGATLTATEVVPTNQTSPIDTDYTTALNNIAGAPDGIPDFIYHVTNAGSAGNFVRQIRTLPAFSSTFSSTRLGSASPYLTDSLWKAANGITPGGTLLNPPQQSLAEGFLVSAYEYPPSDALEDFYDDYDNLFGTLMEAFPFTFTNLTPSSADAYNILLDAIETVAIVVNKNKILIPRKALKDALFATEDVQGLTGLLDCNCDQPDEVGQCDGPNYPGECNRDIQVMVTEVQCSSPSACAFIPQ